MNFYFPMESGFVGAYGWGMASVCFLCVLGWGWASAEHSFFIQRALYVHDDKGNVSAYGPWLGTVCFFFFLFLFHEGLLAKAVRPFPLIALIIAFRRNNYY